MCHVKGALWVKKLKAAQSVLPPLKNCYYMCIQEDVVVEIYQHRLPTSPKSVRIHPTVLPDFNKYFDLLP